MARAPLAQLFAYADRRFGVFTLDDARRYAVPDRTVHGLAARHIVERLHRGVFRVVGAHDEWNQRLFAALVRCGPKAVASHRSAAALHAFDGFTRGPLDVTVRPQEKYSVTGVRVWRLMLSPEDRCRVGVIPATSPVRTLIDLGSVVDEATLVRALDGAERDGKVKRHVLVRRLDELGRRQGTAVLRRVLSQREAIGRTPQSVLERAFLDLVTAAGLPQPVRQHPVVRADGKPAYLDFAYPDRRLAIEVDGNCAHATPAQRASDHERTNHLPEWRFLRFTYEDVYDRPDYVITVLGRN
jgi:very-short-patch-repair endonuclease